MHRHVMHGERPVACDHHDAVHDRLVVERHGIGCDGRLRARHALADGGGDRVLERAYAVERHGAANRDREVDERFVADRTRTHLLDAYHAGDFCRRRGDPLGGALRRRIRQRVDGAAAEPPTGDADQDRNHERGDGIRPPQAGAHAGKPDQHGERGPQVG